MVKLAEKILDLPIEGVTAWARLLLTFVAFLPFLLTAERSHLDPVHLVLLAYLGFGLTLVLANYRQPFGGSAGILIHAVDVGAASLLVALTDGVASPFFVFFLFTVLTGTLRWEWQGALITTLIIAGILLGLWAPDVQARSASAGASAEGARAVIRLGFLLIGGAMLAYMGAYRERARKRFAKLAQWPRMTGTDQRTDGLALALAHAADVMRAPRMLAIWDETDEPHRHVLLWSAEKGLQYSREEAHLFGDLVAGPYRDRAFLFGRVDGHRTSRFAPLDPELTKTIGITTAATAAFRQPTCRGRVFALDRVSFSEEDLSSVSVIAARIGIELEERILRDKLAHAVAEQERARLGRDLHDGVLQGLAAASIRLKVLATSAGPEAETQLKVVRDLLADEAHRIRVFVEATRKMAPSPGGLVPLAPDLQKQVERLRELWSCEIECEFVPPDLTTSLSTSRNIGHMVAEAVANAVRHGRASRVSIRVARQGDRTTLAIQDNGDGFETLTAGHSPAELDSVGGPRSLRARIEELGGTLYLSSSSAGTNITVELPA